MSTFEHLRYAAATSHRITIVQHASVALARLGLGTDARGMPIESASLRRGGSLDIPLMGKSSFPGLKFTVRNT